MSSNLPPGCSVSDLPGFNEPVIHPLSEELCGLLEDYELPQPMIDELVEMFDRVLETDRFMELTSDELLFYALHYVHEHATGYNCVWLTHQDFNGNITTFEGSYTEALVKLINFRLKNCVIKEDFHILIRYTQLFADYPKLKERIASDELFDKIEAIIAKINREYYYGAHPDKKGKI